MMSKLWYIQLNDVPSLFVCFSFNCFVVVVLIVCYFFVLFFFSTLRECDTKSESCGPFSLKIVVQL